MVPASIYLDLFLNLKAKSLVELTVSTFLFISERDSQMLQLLECADKDFLRNNAFTTNVFFFFFF